jgi:hypothetical protein
MSTINLAAWFDWRGSLDTDLKCTSRVRAGTPTRFSAIC